jgi:hypothetical protein
VVNVARGVRPKIRPADLDIPQTHPVHPDHSKPKDSKPKPGVCSRAPRGRGPLDDNEDLGWPQYNTWGVERMTALHNKLREVSANLGTSHDRPITAPYKERYEMRKTSSYKEENDAGLDGGDNDIFINVEQILKDLNLDANKNFRSINLVAKKYDTIPDGEKLEQSELLFQLWETKKAKEARLLMWSTLSGMALRMLAPRR